MFCKKKATLLVAILCVFAVSFVACSKKDAAATGADGATSQEVTKADKKAEEKKAKAEEKKAEKSKKGSSEAKLPTTPNAEEDFIVELTEDGTGVVVKEYKGKSGGVYIPATIQGLPVKEVNLKLSSDNKVTAIVVSDGCTDVNLWGGNRSSIKYVSLPDSVTEFSGLDETSITEFEFPAGVKVVDGLPKKTLEKISFRGTPEEIGHAAFFGSKIKTITLPDSIKGIRSQAFMNCIALESINLPASLEWIGEGGSSNDGYETFDGCSNLKEIIIPDSLTSVDFPWNRSVFGGCSSLSLATQAQLRKLGYESRF